VDARAGCQGFPRQPTFRRTLDLTNQKRSRDACVGAVWQSVQLIQRRIGCNDSAAHAAYLTAPILGRLRFLSVAAPQTYLEDTSLPIRYQNIPFGISSDRKRTSAQLLGRLAHFLSCIPCDPYESGQVASHGKQKGLSSVSPTSIRQLRKLLHEEGLKIAARTEVKTKIFSISSVKLFRLENNPLRKF
jgi:hypothetical protein